MTRSTLIYAIATAILLCSWTMLAVPVKPELWLRDYYAASSMLYPRALMGTLAHALQLSPVQFVQMMQGFRFAGVCLIALTMFTRFESRFAAFCLTALCALTAPAYALNAFGGYVDAGMDFFLLAACVVMLEGQTFAMLPLLALAVLTHDLAIIASVIPLAWLALHKRKQSLRVIALWTLLVMAYLCLTWDRTTSGDAASGYAQLLVNGTPKEFFSLAGLFSAGGMLWVAIGLCMGLRRDPAYLLFVAVALAACLAPMLVAFDTTRIVKAPLLAFILLVANADSINPKLRQPLWLGALALLATIQITMAPVWVLRGAAHPILTHIPMLPPACGTNGCANTLDGHIPGFH